MDRDGKLRSVIKDRHDHPADQLEDEGRTGALEKVFRNARR